jgi:signal transduction histidine kinase
VQVDLGEEKVIESVVLIPARPGDMADTIGYGFPVRFRVEAAVDEGFVGVVAIGGSGGEDYANPGDRRVVLGAGGVRGRYVRVTAEKLWVGPGRSEAGGGVFALAEMEVNAGGRNVALGGVVTASGQMDGKMERWAPAFLVDGVAPPEGMGTYADWLAAMARKYEILKEAGPLERRPWELREEADWKLGWLGCGMAGMLVVAGVAGWWSGLVRERRRTQQLRAGIARDLHDEIGSNLSSIGLLSELAIGAAPDAEAMQMELEDIRRVALQTADSMHDIVWLIGPGQKTMGDLSARMRETAGLMLAGMEWTVEAPDGGGAERLSLGAQRDMYLFFKEALHNIRRHAGATRVRIQLVRRGRTMELTVEDNGRGFDPERKSTGHGLANMKQRAEACRGSLVIGAGNGSGARLVFTIPCGG